MLLTIDVGNTNVGLGVFRGSGPGAELVGDWRIRTDRDRTTDEHGMLFKHLLEHRDIDLADIHHVAISSVVPTMNETLLETSRRYLNAEPFVVGPDTATGICIKYQPPSDVGADRICNAVGAYAEYGGPAVVVDFGTATTFDAIAHNGDYLGGAILPGIGISMDALFRQAARLYRVELVAPPNAIGDTTVHSMQSGLVFGFAGQTDAMVERFRAELGPKTRVVATGGLAELIYKHSKTIEVVDQLITINGLRLLYERNMCQGCADPASKGRPTITDRERAILGLISTGRSNKEIAHQLGIQMQTVKNHVSRLLEKLHMEDRVQLAVYSLDHHIDADRHKIQP
jgi:type III pantothenate kinase